MAQSSSFHFVKILTQLRMMTSLLMCCRWLRLVSSAGNLRCPSPTVSPASRAPNGLIEEAKGTEIVTALGLTMSHMFWIGMASLQNAYMDFAHSMPGQL